MVHSPLGSRLQSTSSSDAVRPRFKKIAPILTGQRRTRIECDANHTRQGSRASLSQNRDLDVNAFRRVNTKRARGPRSVGMKPVRAPLYQEESHHVRN